MNNCWIYQGECLNEPPSGYYGFIYKITDLYGKVYFGKKAFFHSLKKKITKKVIKETKTRKRIERIQKDSEWLDYWGSSKELLKYIESDPEGLNILREKLLNFVKQRLI